MKRFISENWYKAIMALSFFIFSCGVFIYSIRDNKALANPRKTDVQGRTCVGGFYSPTSGASLVVWSDGTVSIASR